MLCVILGLAASCGHDHRPSVVLVTIDTIRADRVSAYGYERPTSPTLDSLAATGVLFEKAYSQGNSTAPSHASILSGKHASDHGLYSNGRRLNPDRARTLAQYFRTAGYRTGAFVSVAYLNDQCSGLDLGFQHFDNVRREQGSIQQGANRWARPAQHTVKRALRWLEKNRNRPCFLWIHVYDPHAPYAPEDRFANRFVGSWTPRIATLRDLHLGLIDPSEARRRHPETNVEQDTLFVRTYQHRDPRRSIDEIDRLFSAADRDCIEVLYDGEIAQTDAAIGNLLRGVRATFDNPALPPLVVVLGDHGESFGSGGVYAAHRSIYEACVRVPMLMSWAGRLPAGRRVESPVQGIDVLPTVLELLDLEAATLLPGRSLVAACPGNSTPNPHPILIEHANRSALAMIDWPWKVIVSTAELYDPAPHVYRHKGTELYRLDSDPREMRDLSASLPQTAQDMKARALAWALRDGVVHEDAPPALDSLMTRQLRALGYIE